MKISNPLEQYTGDDWILAKEALIANNRPAFDENDPAGAYRKEGFLLLKKYLAEMKPKEQGAVPIAAALEAAEAWQNAGIPFNIPANHAFQIYGYYLSVEPDPFFESRETIENWNRLGEIYRTGFGLDSYFQTGTPEAASFLKAIVKDISGIAFARFLHDGVLKADDKIEVDLCYFKDVKPGQSTVQMPAVFSGLLDGNRSSIKHIVAPRLSVDSKSGVLILCMRGLKKLLAEEDLNSNGIDRNFALAAEIVKRTDMWNMKEEGLIGGSVATHLILSGNSNTTDQTCSLIDCMGSRKIPFKSTTLLAGDSIFIETLNRIKRTVFEAGKSFNAWNTHQEGNSLSVKKEIRSVLRIYKRLGKNAEALGISVPSPEMLNRAVTELNSRLSELILDRAGHTPSPLQILKAIPEVYRDLNFPTLSKDDLIRAADSVLSEEALKDRGCYYHVLREVLHVFEPDSHETVNDESIEKALLVFNEIETRAYADLEGSKFEKVWTPFASSFLEELKKVQPVKPTQALVFEEPDDVHL